MAWDVRVDWGLDGNYISIWGDVILATWRLGMGRAYQSVADEATCEITLRNTEGKYSPENTNSPYHPHLVPFRPIEILSDGHPMWRGWVESIHPLWEPAATYTGKTVATLRGISAKQLLQDLNMILPLQQGKRADEIIAYVLKRVVLPSVNSGRWVLGRVGNSELGVTTYLGSQSDYAALDEGVVVFNFYGDRRGEGGVLTGYQIIKDVTEAERGQFFFGRDGRATFWNRDRLRQPAVNDGVVASNGDIRPKGVDYRFGESLINRVQVSLSPRKLVPRATLWELDHEVFVRVGHRVSFEAMFTDEYQQPAGATKVWAEDVMFSTGEGVVALAVLGDRAQVTVTNLRNTGATLSRLRLVGEAVSVENKVEMEAEDATSIRNYGYRREMRLDLPALESADDALAIAAFELDRRRLPRGEVSSISLLNAADGASNAHQLDWGMGSRLRVALPELGHDAPYWVVGERHSVRDGGMVHETQYLLEPVYFPALDATFPLLDASHHHTRLAQSHTSEGETVETIYLGLRKVGAPTGDLTLRLYDSRAYIPRWQLGTGGKSKLGTTTILAIAAPSPLDPVTDGASDPVSAASLGAGIDWVRFDFPLAPSLGAGLFWLVLESSDSFSATNYVEWGVSTGEGFLDETAAWWYPHSYRAIYQVG